MYVLKVASVKLDNNNIKKSVSHAILPLFGTPSSWPCHSQTDLHKGVSKHTQVRALTCARMNSHARVHIGWSSRH